MLNSPKNETSVFLSYARKDGAYFTKTLLKDLQIRGFVCWMDTRSIESGQEFDSEIQKGIEECDFFIYSLTPHSVIEKGFCRKELAYAQQLGKTIIPLMIIECRLPLLIANLHWLDFRTNYREGFKELISRLTSTVDMFEVVDVAKLDELYIYFDETNKSILINYGFIVKNYRNRILPSKLPETSVPLFGRDEPFFEVRNTLIPNTGQVILLSGLAGVGKTVLASAISWSLVPHFDGGVIWINGPISDINSLYSAIAQRFDQIDYENLNKITSHDIRELLSRNSHIVVLDDFEDDKLIREFIKQCAPTAVIITSRKQIPFVGKLFRILDIESIPTRKLLFRTAAQIDSGFDSEIDKIVGILGGHPQAIAISGAICLHDSMNPSDFLSELINAENKVKMLSLGSDTSPSVWTTFLASFERLNQDLQNTLLSMGVLNSNKISPEMLSCLTGATLEEAQGHLRQLAQREFLRLSRGRNFLVKTYIAHDLIFVFIRGMLNLRLQFYQEIVREFPVILQRYMDKFVPGENDRYYLELLNAEFETLSMLAKKLYYERHWEILNQAGLKLWNSKNMLYLRAHATTSIELINYAFEAAINIEVELDSVIHLENLGQEHRFLGNYKIAHDTFQKALIISQKSKEPLRHARALTGIGMIYRERGQFDDALKLFNDAIEIVKDVSTEEQALLYSYIANIHRAKKAYNHAEENYLRAIKLADQYGDKINKSYSLFQLARTYLDQNKIEQALEYAEQAKKLSLEISASHPEVYSYWVIGECRLRIGQLNEAKIEAQKALQIAEQIGVRKVKANVLELLAKIAIQENDYLQAINLLQECVELRTAIESLDKERAEQLLKTVRDSNNS